MSDEQVQAQGSDSSLNEIIGIDVALDANAGKAVIELVTALQSLDTTLTNLGSKDLGSFSSRFIQQQAAMQASIRATNELLITQRELMGAQATAPAAAQTFPSVAQRLGRDEGGSYASRYATVSEATAIENSVRARLSRSTGESYTPSPITSIRNGVVYENVPFQPRSVYPTGKIVPGYGPGTMDVEGAAELERHNARKAKRIAAAELKAKQVDLGAIPPGAIKFESYEQWDSLRTPYFKRNIEGADYLIPEPVETPKPKKIRGAEAKARSARRVVEDSDLGDVVGSSVGPLDLAARERAGRVGLPGVDLSGKHVVVPHRTQELRSAPEAESSEAKPRRKRRTKAEMQATEERLKQQIRDESAAFVESAERLYPDVEIQDIGGFQVPVRKANNAARNLVTDSGRVLPIPTAPPSPSPNIPPAQPHVAPNIPNALGPSSIPMSVPSWSQTATTRRATQPATPPSVPPTQPPPPLTPGNNTPQGAFSQLPSPPLVDRMLAYKHGVMRSSADFQAMNPETQDQLIQSVLSGYGHEGVFRANKWMPRSWQLSQAEQDILLESPIERTFRQHANPNTGVLNTDAFSNQLARERLGFTVQNWQRAQTMRPDWAKEQARQALLAVPEEEVVKAFTNGTMTAAQMTQLLNDKATAASRTMSGWQRVFNGLEFSMVRSIMVMGVMWGTIQTGGQAVAALTDNFLKLDKASSQAAYASGRSIGEMRGQALDAMITGAKYGQGPTEAINAFTQASRYTKDTSDQQRLVDTSAKMAVMTGGDQAKMMKDLITITRQWNLSTAETTRVLDVSAAAVKNTNANLGDFVESMAQGAIVGKEMGWSLEQTAGMYAGFLQMSGKGAGEATTFFERLTTIGSRPTDLKQLNDIGVYTRDQNGELLRSSQILDQLAAKWSRLSDTQKRMASDSMAGQRQLDNFLVLINNYAKLTDYQKEFANSAGEGERAVTTMMSNISDQAGRVFPAIGALVTAALTPDSETMAWWTNWLRGIADSAGALAAVSSKKGSSPGLKYAMDQGAGFDVAVYEALGWNDSADARLREAIATASKIDNSKYRGYGAERALRLEDAEKELRLDPTSVGMSESEIIREIEGRAATLGWQKKDLRSTSQLWNSIIGAGYRAPEDGAAAINGAPGTSRPSGFEPTAFKFGNLDITKYTRAEVDSLSQMSENLSKQYLAAIAPLDKNGEYAKKIKEEWANTAVVLRLVNGELMTLTGPAAAFLGQTEKIKENLQRPNIQTMPELNKQTAPKLQGYLKQYEGLLTNLGVKQTPQDYLMFGQGGQLYKYFTSSEAMTLAMELLREEIKKNTDEQGKLRGHYNIPTAFGYKPPTPWEYYDKTGARDMGPVNYPWLFKDGPTDKDGKPLIGSVPSGITNTYATTFGASVDRFDVAVTRLLTGASPDGSKSGSASALQTWARGENNVSPASSPAGALRGASALQARAREESQVDGAPYNGRGTYAPGFGFTDFAPTQSRGVDLQDEFRDDIFSKYNFTNQSRSVLASVPLYLNDKDSREGYTEYRERDDGKVEDIAVVLQSAKVGQFRDTSVHEFAHAWFFTMDKAMRDQFVSAARDATKSSTPELAKLISGTKDEELYATIASFIMGDTSKLPASLQGYYSGMFGGLGPMSGVAMSTPTGARGAPSRNNRLNVPYADLITAAANKYGIPQENLAAIIKAESAFKPGAINRASGATGLGQVMPSDTHIIRNGVNYDRMFRDRPTTKQLLDPATNIEWTARILAGNWKRTGSWEGAASRYFGIGRDAQGTTTSQAMRNYTNALAQINGGRPMQVQGIPQTNSALSNISSSNRMMATNMSAMPRMASAMTMMASMASQQVSLLSRIAASVGKPIVVTVQGTGSVSASGAIGKGSAASGTSGMTGANAGPWRK
ncbi:MAG: phage tail tape measure protein [Chloroflexi bacterium]|nr:phage tail tape measure protein [Chloroflexota bacterium]